MGFPILVRWYPYIKSGPRFPAWFLTAHHIVVPVAAVRELWDFEQDYPESCESDETAMEEDTDGGS